MKRRHSSCLTMIKSPRVDLSLVSKSFIKVVIISTIIMLFSRGISSINFTHIPSKDEYKNEDKVDVEAKLEKSP